LTAATKFRIQVPTVTLSVMMAAVDGCSVTVAVAAASAIVSRRSAHVRRHGHELGRIQRAAVAFPQHDGDERRR